MSLFTDGLVENATIDLKFLETVMPEHEGGEVTFSVKELLVDLRHAVEKVGESTKADLQATELRITTYIHNVDQAAKERDAANAAEIEALSKRATENELWRARVIGAASVAALMGGGIGAALMRVLAGG